MIKSAVILLAVAGGLFIFDRAMAAREGDDRVATMRIGRFAKLPKLEYRKADTATKLVVASGGGAKWEYVKGADGWRCPSYHDAPVSEDRLKSVITKAFEAEGIIETFDSNRHGEFGFGGPSSFQVDASGVYKEDRTPPNPDPMAMMGAPDSRPHVYGPEEPWSYAWDVGNATIDKEGSFIRRRGDKAVWHVDQNSHLELDAAPGQRLPPLLDASLVPMSWLQSVKQVRRMRIKIDGGDEYQLEMRDKKITPEEMRQGKSPYEWWVLQNGTETLADQQQAMSFTSFIMRAPYTDLIAKEKHASLGFDKSRAMVSLLPTEGAACDLYISYQGGARAAVYNAALQLAYEVDAAVIELLAPPKARIMEAGQGMPWKPWLQQMR